VLDTAALGITYVTSVSAGADFILASGFEVLSTGEDGPNMPISKVGLRTMLAEAAAARLPLVLANPDEVTVGRDALTPMPGMLAKWYSEIPGHGRIHIMGKPDRAIYDAALTMLKPGARVLAIGDSLAHDIAGAAQVGLDSYFVTNGIHAGELGGPDDHDGIARLAELHGSPLPTYSACDFAW
jgi:ribonucleotide monophosphatase NagD (HAD superfamily)